MGSSQGRVRGWAELVGLVVLGASLVVLFVDMVRWRGDGDVSVWWWIAGAPAGVGLLAIGGVDALETWRDPESEPLGWDTNWRGVMFAILAPIIGIGGLISDPGGPWTLYVGFLVAGAAALVFMIRQFLKPERRDGRGSHRSLQ